MRVDFLQFTAHQTNVLSFFIHMWGPNPLFNSFSMPYDVVGEWTLFNLFKCKRWNAVYCLHEHDNVWFVNNIV